MFADSDLAYWLVSPSRATRWPITSFLGVKTDHGKQPTGGISMEVPRGAWWVDASAMLSVPAGPGVGYFLETYFRDFDSPFVMAKIQAGDLSYDPQTDSLSITAESAWSWALRARLIFDGGINDPEKAVSYTGLTADDMLREVWRDQMVAPTLTPAGYPGTASRTDFGAITIAVEADTSSHATSPDWDCDSGRNLLEATLEIAEKWDLRCTWSVSGSTLTLGVKTPYANNDYTFDQTGWMLSDTFGAYSKLGLSYDFSAVRNLWCVRDGTSRYWLDDTTSATAHGNLEDIMKQTSGGGVSTNTMKAYEAAHQMQSAYTVQGIGMDLSGAPDWIAAVTDYGVADTVTVQNAAIGTDDDWTIVGMSIAHDANGPRVALAIDDERRNYAREAWRKPGPSGGFGAGSRWVDLSG